MARSSTSFEGIPLLAVARTETMVPATSAITMSRMIIAVDTPDYTTAKGVTGKATGTVIGLA